MVTKQQGIKMWQSEINNLKKRNEYSKKAMNKSNMPWEKKEYAAVIKQNNKEIKNAQSIIERIKKIK